MNTFDVSLDRVIELAKFIPDNKLLVAESGIHTREDVRRLEQVGIKSILVGTALMKVPDVQMKIKELLGPKRNTIKIKICGLTNIEDAQEAIKHGADYLGFIVNYAKSPRSLSFSQASELIKKIKAESSKIKCVGVFVDAGIKDIKEAHKVCDFDAIQLHGDETPEYCQQLKDELKIEIFKAIILKTKKDLQNMQAYKSIVDKCLIDSGRGSGNLAPLDLLLGETVDCLAGGITPDNVRELIRKVQPKMIDVGSGVESSPGKKDLKLLPELFNIVNNI